MKRCRQCGGVCPDEDAFCNVCGAKFTVMQDIQPIKVPMPKASPMIVQKSDSDNMKLCLKCGNYSSSENKFCTKCGARFPIKYEPKVKTKSKQEVETEALPLSNTKPQKKQKRSSGSRQHERHKSRILLIILIVIFSLLAVGALIFFILRGLERYGIIKGSESIKYTSSATEGLHDEHGRDVPDSTKPGSTTTSVPDTNPTASAVQEPTDTPGVTQAPIATPAMTETPLYDVYFTDENNRGISEVTVFSGDVIRIRNMYYYSDNTREVMSKSAYRLSWDVKPSTIVSVHETEEGFCDIVVVNPGTCEIRALVWIDGKVAFYGEPIKVMVEAAPSTPMPTPDPYNVYLIHHETKEKYIEYTLAAGTNCDFDFAGVSKWKTGKYVAEWCSEDENVATVDSQGVVKGWHSGSCVIRLTIRNSETGDTSEYTVAPLVVTVYGDAAPTIKPATPTPSPKPLTLWRQTDVTRSTNITKDGLTLTAGGSSVELTFDGKFDDYSKIKDKYTFKWRIYDLDGNESSKYATVKLKGSGSNNGIITPESSECNKKCYVILKIYDTSGRKVYESKKVYLIIKKMK